MAIVCESNKYIYVSGGKCATTSINNTLRAIRGFKGYEPAHIDADLWKRYNKHLPAKKIKDLIGNDIWNEYFKFTFIRNTYSWVVSSFFFMVKIGMLKGPEDGLMTMENFQQVVDYYKSSVGRRYDDSYPIRSQKVFISDNEGKIIVDWIGRYESLKDDFATLCQKIKIPSIPLSVINTSHNDKVHWKDQYRKNSEAKDFVYNNWKIDIDYFKFELE